MPLDDDSCRVVEAFRTRIEAFAASLGLHEAERHDRRDHWLLATRWVAGRHLWLELAVRPFLPQVRVALLTDDPWRRSDIQELIAASDFTLPEFVARGLAGAGLHWPDPPVEHYREPGPRYYFATPVELDRIAQLADEALCMKVQQILTGYHQAFSPIDSGRRPESGGEHRGRP